MMFSSKIIPRLGQSADNEEWYLNALWKSLNEYLDDLERAVNNTLIPITGVTVTPAGTPTSITFDGNILFRKKRFSYVTIKNAMWCGDGSQSFINLFTKIGEIIAEDFKTLAMTTIVTGFTDINLSTTIPYKTCGMEFMTEIMALGASNAITPEVFHNTLDTYLNMAFHSIPQIITPVAGAGKIPVGTFTGVATFTPSLVLIV